MTIGIATAPPLQTLHFPYYTQSAGFYQKRGLDVEFKLINGDVLGLRALAAGDVDVEVAGCAAALQAMEQGASLRIISAFDPSQDFYLAVQKGIASPKQLEGKSVGVSQPGALSYTVPKLLIQGDGGDFSKVNVVAIGGTAARLQALIAKKIDASVLDSANVAKVASYDYLSVIANVSKTLPNYLYGCEVVTEKTLASRKDALQAFVTATMEGVHWTYDHVDEAVSISLKLLPDTNKDDLTASVKALAAERYWNESAVLPTAAWAFTTKALQDSGDLKGPLDYSKFVLPEFAQTAQKEVANK